MNTQQQNPNGNRFIFPASRGRHTGFLFACLVSLLPGVGFAGVEDIGPREPYVAPQYVPPPPPVSRLHLIDNEDGTITDPDSGLMWAKKDSYAELGKCLNWYQANDYIDNLNAGGYDDWRIPTIFELAGIYDNTKENILGWDNDPNHPLALDEKFAKGAAYWYWSANYENTRLTECCGRTFYYVKGMVHVRRFTACDNGGVRGVRDLGKNGETKAGGEKQR